MIQEEIHKFIDNFKYFKVMVALCFNSLTPSKCQHVIILALTPSKASAASAFWLRPQPQPPQHTDVILERSLRLNIVSVRRLLPQSAQYTCRHLPYMVVLYRIHRECGKKLSIWS